MDSDDDDDDADDEGADCDLPRWNCVQGASEEELICSDTSRAGGRE